MYLLYLKRAFVKANRLGPRPNVVVEKLYSISLCWFSVLWCVCVRNFVSGDINLYLIFLLFSKLTNGNKKLVGKFYGYYTGGSSRSKAGVYLLHIRSKNMKLKPQYCETKVDWMKIIDVQNQMCRNRLTWLMLTSFSSFPYFFTVNIYILLSRCWGEGDSSFAKLSLYQVIYYVTQVQA